MSFARPELFALAPAAALLVAVAIAWQWRRTARLIAAFGGPAPARRLMGRVVERFPAGRAVSAVVAAVALSLAASGIGREREIEPPATPIDLIVSLDMSRSMTARDVDPSRIARAKAVVERIVAENVVDRIALTLFADWPYGLVPLTDDDDVLDFFVPWLTPDMIDMRDQGTSLAAALGHAVGTWQARARPGAIPVVLIISDGESHTPEGDVFDSLAVAVDAGMRIWTAGVGTEGGAPLFVPRSASAPLLDGSGGQVVAGFDAELLRSVAAEGGGGFHDVTSDAGIRALLGDLRTLRGGSDDTDEAGVGTDPTELLLLIALVLFGVDAMLDAPHRWRRARPARERSW